MKRNVEENQTDADFALRKREQFAISLRKKKKQEIIALKRKKTFENLSKTKFTAQPSGQPQSQNQSFKKQTPDFVQTPEMVGFVLDSIENMIGDRAKEGNLYQLIEGLRLLTVNEEPAAAYHAFIYHPKTIPLLMQLIGMSNPQRREIQIKICSQALWTVQNLSFLKEICSELITNHNLL